VEQVVMASFGGASGLAYPDPVGSLVTGTFETILFHEGFQQV
jgi:hypothetical protein